MVTVAPRGAGEPGGFTLIELLVALLIMGLMLGLAAPVLRPDARSQLRDEAERLAQLFELAGDETRFGGHRLVWTSDGQSYRFWRADTASRGKVIGDDAIWQQHRLPAGMRLSGLSIESLPVAGAMRLHFDSEGATTAFSLQLSQGDAHVGVTASPLGEIAVLTDTEVGHVLAPSP